MQVTARLLDQDNSSHPATRKAAFLISGNVGKREGWMFLLAQFSPGIIRASYARQVRGASFPCYLLSCEVAACFCGSCRSCKQRAAKQTPVKRAKMNWPAVGVRTHAQARWCWRCACSSSSCCHICRSTRKVKRVFMLSPLTSTSICMLSTSLLPPSPSPSPPHRLPSNECFVICFASRGSSRPSELVQGRP